MEMLSTTHVAEKDTRIRNLRAILDSATYKGNKSALSRALQYERPGYLTKLLNGKKSFGEKVARHIEGKLGMKKGALDATSDAGAGVRDAAVSYQPSLSDEAKQLAADWQQLDEPLRSQILVMIHSLVVSQKKTEREAAKRAKPVDKHRPRPDA